jgi:hypothetical protein
MAPGADGLLTPKVLCPGYSGCSGLAAPIPEPRLVYAHFPCVFLVVRAMFCFAPSAADAADGKEGMETGMEKGSPAAARKQAADFGKAPWRKRIFARLREGWAYDEIAREEGIAARR